MAKEGKKNAKGIIQIANTSQLMAHENRMKKYNVYSEVEQVCLLKQVTKIDSTFVNLKFDLDSNVSPANKLVEF